MGQAELGGFGGDGGAEGPVEGPDGDFEVDDAVGVGFEDVA